jgi:hypothetical protein
MKNDSANAFNSESGESGVRHIPHLLCETPTGRSVSYVYFQGVNPKASCNARAEYIDGECRRGVSSKCSDSVGYDTVH